MTYNDILFVFLGITSKVALDPFPIAFALIAFLFARRHRGAIRITVGGTVGIVYSLWHMWLGMQAGSAWPAEIDFATGFAAFAVDYLAIRIVWSLIDRFRRPQEKRAASKSQ
jgi:hypothetical protein